MAWDALTVLNTSTNYTLPIGLNSFFGVHTTLWGPFFAASVLATIPNVIVFVFSLRWMKNGVSLGGIR